MSVGSRRRVAIVLKDFGGGGVQRSMLRLAEAFLDRGLAVDLVVAATKGELLNDVPEGARIVELAMAPLSRARWHGLAADPRAWALLLRPKRGMSPLLKPLVQRLPSLVACLREAQPDAVLTATPAYNVIAVWARRVSGLSSRVVISVRNRLSHPVDFSATPWGQPGVNSLLRRAYLGADAIVAVSDGVADDLAACADIPRQCITTVYNPVVGPNLFAESHKPSDHHWFGAGEPPVILAAGRLVPQKDFATLIRAFALVRARRRARLVILGSASRECPEEAADLRELPARLGIADDVDLPGFCHNPFAFMSRAAVFVLSSVHEGLGNVLIEALACGTPVISTDCPSGPREILDDGSFGPLVPVGDVAALARAIDHVLDHPPAAESLRARAELFSVQRSADAYLELLLPPKQEIPLAGGARTGCHRRSSGPGSAGRGRRRASRRGARAL
jgi:glycosyltransferase involved in cell wall biosynthesis